MGFESWLEREHVMLLDFDPAVVAFSSQPFWLLWHDGKRLRRHAPDFFARLDDGSGMVVDVRADDQIPAADAEVFEVTARACASVGRAFRRVGNPDPVLAANVRWLAGYRHPRCSDSAVAALLIQAFTQPAPLLEGVQAVGDPIAVLPVAYHLLWARVLRAELFNSPGTVVLTAPRKAPLPPQGLLQGVPVSLVERARWWEQHIVEVLTGMPPEAGPGAVASAGYDPNRTTLRQREIARVAELKALGHEVPRSTFQRLRRSYVQEGVWGLVDGRATRPQSPAGLVDERIVDAVRWPSSRASRPERSGGCAGGSRKS